MLVFGWWCCCCCNLKNHTKKFLFFFLSFLLQIYIFRYILRCIRKTSFHIFARLPINRLCSYIPSHSLPLPFRSVLLYFYNKYILYFIFVWKVKVMDFVLFDINNCDYKVCLMTWIIIMTIVFFIVFHRKVQL